MNRAKPISGPSADIDKIGRFTVTIPLENIRYFDKVGNEVTAAEAFKSHLGDKDNFIPNFAINTNGPVHIEVLPRKIAIYDELTGCILRPELSSVGICHREARWLCNTLEEFAKEDGVPFDADYRKNYFAEVAAW